MIIKKDTHENNLIHVEHREVSGTFELRKPTFGLKLEVERLKGSMLGPFPTPDGENIAERCSVVQVGFSKVPEQFNVQNIISEKLLLGLYEEVVRFWNSFRESDQE